MENLKSVAVDPDMRFYNLLESYPYTPASALSEFIDNALQAFLDAQIKGIVPSKEKLTIDIQFNDGGDGDGSVTVLDNGVGIGRSVLQKALKPAFSQKNKSLSEFGIGMKAAAIWFGRKWTLSSYSRQEEQAFKIEFDLDELLRKGENTVPVEIDSTIENYGVKIKITNLRNKIYRRIVEETWSQLQEVYQIYIIKDKILNLKLQYNGTHLAAKKSFPQDFFTPLFYSRVEIAKNPDTNEFQLYSYGDAITWKRNVEFEFNGKKIVGFLSILKISSQKSNPGIRLYRYKRLIRGSGDMPYRPVALVGTANKHAPSRVYGELHLDGQPISNHKGDFQFDEAFFLETLREQNGIQELIDQAEAYRRREIEKGQVQHFETYDDFVAAIKKKTKTSPGRKTSGGQRTNGGKKPSSGVENSPRPTSFRPIDTLTTINLPSGMSLLHVIRNETVELYNISKWWPFCLCYRIVLEVGIIEKLKNKFPDHHAKVFDKSIETLLKYLSNNRDELIDPEKHKSLFKSLRDGGNILGNIPGISLLNLASHGNFQPLHSDVDGLLTNTQSLLEWIAES